MKKHTPLGVTRIFGKFIKGITYFSDEVEHNQKIPIYHRAASCGSSSNDFKKKYLRCYGENAPESIELKKKHIYKCYLERLIFDDMFIHSHMGLPSGNGVLTTTSTITEQNEGHKYQLSERAHNFNSCFLGVKMSINLVYEDNFPTILTVFFKDNNGELIKKEIFERILCFDVYRNGCYTKSVLYTREDNNGIYEEIRRFAPEKQGEEDDDDNYDCD